MLTVAPRGSTKLAISLRTPIFSVASRLKGSTPTLEALEKEGLRVPEDVSVVGFDGVGIENGRGVKLYSMLQPTAQIGSAAAQIMTEQLRFSAKGQTLPPQVRTLPATLFAGNSIKRI